MSDNAARGRPQGTERRFWPVQELRVHQTEDGQRYIDWYPAVFDSLSEDLGGFREKIARRAFSKTLQESDIRALFNHNPDFVLGRNQAKTLKLHADLRGLHASVAPPDTQWAQDLLVSIERGDISGGSFGFETIRDEWSLNEEGEVIRELREVRLFDVSLVSYPAYPAAEGVSVRSALASIIDPEDLLHPLFRLRAGAPLGAEERGRYEAAIAQLSDALPEAPPADQPAPSPETHLHLMEMNRTLLRLRALPPKRR